MNGWLALRGRASAWGGAGWTNSGARCQVTGAPLIDDARRLAITQDSMRSESSSRVRFAPLDCLFGPPGGSRRL
jgi:hypothetical protein